MPCWLASFACWGFKASCMSDIGHAQACSISQHLTDRYVVCGHQGTTAWHFFAPVHQAASCSPAPTGTLPPSWGRPQAFPALLSLALRITNLSGPLPPAWAGDGAFPALTSLQITSGTSQHNRLSGTLPEEWGNSTAFQSLASLTIGNCSIQGMCFCACTASDVHGGKVWMSCLPRALCVLSFLLAIS